MSLYEREKLPAKKKGSKKFGIVKRGPIEKEYFDSLLERYTAICELMMSRRFLAEEKWEDYASYCSSESFRRWSRSVLLRDNYRCQQCSADASVAHHVIYRWWGTEGLADGYAVCQPCHECIHAGLIPDYDSQEDYAVRINKMNYLRDQSGLPRSRNSS